MSDDLVPMQKRTMEELEKRRKATSSGRDYWLAREIMPVLGYETWRRFEEAIERAKEACRQNELDPAKHFVGTGKMVSLGSDATRDIADFFLSRPACYLIAMNGDPGKPEIAAAQAYFAVQTRRMELEDQHREDEKRLELRDKAKVSVRRVSKQAQLAGVSNNMQGVFHDQRYRGLYGKSRREVNASKGLSEGENLLDRAGALELSAHDFQMNLAADVIEREGVRGQQKAIDKNLAVARRVRQTMIDEGATLPEKLALEAPIKEVAARVKASQKRLRGPRTKN
ncbi:MAG: DNA damage-inducible protein D [Rhizomicrobium sp.]